MIRRLRTGEFVNKDLPNNKPKSTNVRKRQSNSSQQAPPWALIVFGVMGTWFLVNTNFGDNSTRSIRLGSHKKTPFQAFAPRFPEYGTREFEQRCPWASPSKRRGSDWTIWVQPIPDSHEGLAEWLSGIVTGFLVAQQVHAQFWVDYGLDVDLLQIWEPQGLNWTVPLLKNASCPEPCRRITGNPAEARDPITLKKIDQALSLALVPSYRHASNLASRKYQLHDSQYRDLEQRLPGFTLDDGMACTFQRLFRMSSKALQYQPDLFTNILPQLRNDDVNGGASALVLSLYIRSGDTDKTAADQSRSTTENYRMVTSVARCAERLEAEHANHSKVVWMVVTDSSDTKQWLTETYSTAQRTVLTTASRGVHSRPRGHPTTRDVVESLLDWYLIGESNAVILNNNWYTFGFLGGLRTSRPMYDARMECSPVKWIAA